MTEDAWKERCIVVRRVPLSGKETRQASAGSQQPVKKVGEHSEYRFWRTTLELGRDP